jgi:oxygen-independent coproporphyrinogen-3 oxidase
VRGHIIERLMCDFSIDLDAIAAESDIATDFRAEREELLPLAAEGLVRITGNRVTVTERGRPFVRLAAAAFDAYLAKSAARHSVAV